MSLSSQSEPAQAEPNNKCPDCVYMKLIGESVESRQWLLQRQSVLEAIELNLTLSFNQQWEQLPAARIKFGIKAGELRLTLKNGTIPYEDREWNDTFDLSIPRERETRFTQKEKSNGKASVNSNGNVKVGMTEGSENTEETKDKIQFSTAQVTTKGLEKSPAWVFEEKTGEQVLKGTIPKQKLATVTVERKPCLIQATFQISKRDVYISDYEGSWFFNLRPNKQKVIKMMVYNYFQPESNPYLSQQELKYD